MNKHRYQKEIILLCKESHKTADQIYQNLKKLYPKIGIGTVYRNLNELATSGVLQKIPGVNNKVIYEYSQDNKNNIHGHLICETTWKIINIDVSKIKSLDLGLPENFELHKVEVIFYGKYKDSTSDCKGKITLN